MSQVIDAIHNHHLEILTRMGDHVTALMANHPDADPEGLVDFLKGELMPHAAGEEQALYPAVEPLIKEHGRATATMGVDHEFIAEYVREIENAVRAMQAAGEGGIERAMVLGRLQRLALQLDGILRLHLEKEERIYLPLFEKYLTDAERQQVLDTMHEPGG